jgi:transposase InsO family protein
MLAMPKAYPEEFRRDVVAIARKGEIPLTQIAKDFGISQSCVKNWVKQADIEDGNRPGVTRDGLYLCAIKDVYSNRIVGYSIDSRMKASLAVSALHHAIGARSPVATIVHSDRGSQLRSRKFVNALSTNGLQGSMGRVGACGDNAAMESFFALLQKNVLDHQRWATRQELRLAIVVWIEKT